MKTINKLSIGFSAGRAILFLLIYLTTQSFDAQWQLAYIPILIIDLPVSLLYWRLPFPIGEAFIGPVWWFILSRLVWGAISRDKIKGKRTNLLKILGWLLIGMLAIAAILKFYYGNVTHPRAF